MFSLKLNLSLAALVNNIFKSGLFCFHSMQSVKNSLYQMNDWQRSVGNDWQMIGRSTAVFE